MTKLSININKFALIRNARGNNLPNLSDITNKCIDYGVNGITVHPRPDERHIKFSDLHLISKIVKSYKNIEFNIEGYPSKKFIKEIDKIETHQITLVPDPPNALTSSFGWDCKKYKKLLTEVVKNFQKQNIRVSLFINPSIKNLEYLCDILPDRVELYTFDYAKNFSTNPSIAIKKYIEVVKFTRKIAPTIGINAGHDLNLLNLKYLLKKIKDIKEVSIGHAFVCDSFEFGLKDTIEKYLKIVNS